MAILTDDGGEYDEIEMSLSKLGITEWDVKDDRSMLANADELNRYHVVFIPCADPEEKTSTDPVAKTNVQKFVASGASFT